MLLHVAIRSLLTFRTGDVSGALDALTTQALVVICLGGLLSPATAWATRLAAILVAVRIVLSFPLTANHVFLEFLVLLFLSILDESRKEEGDVLMRGVRWLTVGFFFHTGLQKLLYGRYFDGQFLGHSIAFEDRFAWFFRPMLPAAEFARLRGQATVIEGAGPYSVDSALFLVLSNGVYLFEMAAAVLLLVPRTRSVTAVVSILFVVGIEAGARELIFGVFMISLFLLFMRRSPMRWSFWAIAAVYGYLAAGSFGLVPFFRYFI